MLIRSESVATDLVSVATDLKTQIGWKPVQIGWKQPQPGSNVFRGLLMPREGAVCVPEHDHRAHPAIEVTIPLQIHEHRSQQPGNRLLQRTVLPHSSDRA